MRFSNETIGTFEQSIIKRGYIKYKQDYKQSDYVYWKSFERDEERNKGYSIGLAFYDYSKYPQYKVKECISIGMHFMLGNDLNIDRMDLGISDDKMTVEEFENFCDDFYEFYLTREKSIQDEKKES